MKRALMLSTPLIFFAAVAGIFLGGLFADREQDLPSTRVGQVPPALPTEPLGQEPLLTAADFPEGEVTIVNFWASWCPPCRLEHPTLLEMSQSGLRLAGVNFRDDEDRALEYLSEHGNPFFASGFDEPGRFALEWGVTAPPETFIIGRDGKVAFRFAGPLVGADYENRFLPALEAALAE